NAETYFTSGIGGRSIRASGLCGRKIGPLHPAKTSSAATLARSSVPARSIGVRRIMLERSREKYNVVLEGAARRTNSPSYGWADSKPRESTGPAATRQGGPIK